VDRWDYCIGLGSVMVILAIAEGLFNKRLLNMGPDYSLLADAAFLAGAVLMVYGAAHGTSKVPYDENPKKPEPFTTRGSFSSWIRNPLGRLRTPHGVDTETQCISSIASKAGLSERTKKRALGILKRAKDTGISVGEDPIGLAAAALYVACILEREDKTPKDLAEAAGVPEVAIRNRLRGLRDAVGI